MKFMKVAIGNLGCKVNIYESEFVASKLQEAGFEIVDFSNKADIYIINTCTVGVTPASSAISLIVIILCPS